MSNILILILFDAIIGMWAFPLTNVSAIVSVSIVNIMFLWSAIGVSYLIKGNNNSYAKATRAMSTVFSFISIIIAIVFIFVKPANPRWAILTFLIFIGIYVTLLLKFVKGTQNAA